MTRQQAERLFRCYFCVGKAIQTDESAYLAVLNELPMGEPLISDGFREAIEIAVESSPYWKNRDQFEARLAKLQTTEVLARPGNRGAQPASIPKLHGCRQDWMLAHLFVAVKIPQVLKAVKHHGWRLIELRNTPIIRNYWQKDDNGDFVLNAMGRKQRVTEAVFPGFFSVARHTSYSSADSVGIIYRRALGRAVTALR